MTWLSLPACLPTFSPTVTVVTTLLDDRGRSPDAISGRRTGGRLRPPFLRCRSKDVKPSFGGTRALPHPRARPFAPRSPGARLFAFVLIAGSSWAAPFLLADK